MKCLPEALSKPFYVDNGALRVLRGRRFVVDGHPVFPESSTIDDALRGRHPESIDGVYRTVWAGVPHSGVTFCACNSCSSLATRRLTNCRNATLAATSTEPARLNPNALAEEEAYLRSQTDFIDRARDVTDFLTDWLSGSEADYLGAKDEALAHAGDPHPKRVPRVLGLRDLLLDGRFPDRHWGGTAGWKFKKVEIGKPGKLGRLIVDLGIEASLLGFRTTGYLKEVMASRDGCYRDARFRFVKVPAVAALRSVFTDLISPPEKYFFAFFSDDSCLAVRTSHGVVFFNMDISSCDASHSARLFELIIETAPPHLRDDMRVLVEQCSSKLRLSDHNDRRNYILYQLIRPRLLSGSTLTTHINNCANVLIGASIAMSRAETPDEIIAAAAAVGYIVTLDACHTYHSLQFLKHSPCYDLEGIIQPILNLGVFLRSFGTCHGDLPGRGDFRTRADEFQRSLLSGMYPRLDTPLFNGLRRLYGSNPVSDRMATFAAAHYAGKVDCDSGPIARIATAELLERYQLTDLETQELHLCFEAWTFATSVECRAFAKILTADYGLTTLTNDW